MSSRDHSQPPISRAASIALNGVISDSIVNSSIVPQSQHYQKSPQTIVKSATDIMIEKANNHESNIYEDDYNDNFSDGIDLASDIDISKLIKNKIQRNTSIELQDNEINEKEREDVRSRGNTVH